MKLVAKLKCVCGDKRPHFVPPSFGDVGFYACEVPDDSTEQADDVTNHDRINPSEGEG